MNIPLEPTRPIEGVASPAPAAQPKPYSARPLPPWRMWGLLRMAVELRRDVEPLQMARFIVPRGFPGSGIFRGRTNVAKTCTYRATYVPGGFNRDRHALD